MKLSKVLTLFCCTNGANGITSTITNLAIQDFKINRQIAQNKLSQAGRHRSGRHRSGRHRSGRHRSGRHRSGQTMSSGQAIGFAELLEKIKIAQMAADARRRGQNNRRFRPKVGGRIQGGTMEAFRRMQKVVGTYV